jgi:hypothetical protein
MPAAGMCSLAAGTPRAWHALRGVCNRVDGPSPSCQLEQRSWSARKEAADDPCSAYLEPISSTLAPFFTPTCT